MKEINVKSVAELLELVDKAMQVTKELPEDKKHFESGEATEKGDISLADHFLSGEKFFTKAIKNIQKQSDKFINELNKIQEFHECPVLQAQLSMLADQSEAFHSLVGTQARVLYQAYDEVLSDHKGK